MGGLLVAARKDLARSLRDPFSLALWMGVPLLIGLIMSQALGGGSGPRPRPSLLVVDEDQSMATALLRGTLVQPFVAETLDVRFVAADSGRAILDEGGASALLTLSAGLEADLLAGRPHTLTLVTNPSQQILPRMVEELLRIGTELVFYADLLVGEQLRRFDGAPLVAGMALASRMESVGAALDTYLDPPLIDVEVELPESSGTAPVSVGEVLFPGLLLMALLFATQGLSTDVWTEVEEGTLDRARAVPGGLTMLLGGKLLRGAALLAAVSTTANVAAGLAYDVPVARWPLTTAISLVTGLLFLALFQWLALLSTSARGGEVLTNGLLYPLLMVGGSFVPFEIVPDWLADVGSFTPNGYAVVQLRQVLRGTAHTPTLLAGLAGALALTALLTALAARRARTHFGAGR